MGNASLMAQQLPTQSQFGDYSDWPGRDVLDSDGQRLGAVREIYLDRESGRPEWVLVDLSDEDARFVPLAGAEVESWQIRVAVPAAKIHSAPGIGTEPRIDQSEERRLYAHYGISYGDDPEPSTWSSADTDRADDPTWQAGGGEPSNDAPPPAEPPSPAELEEAHIPEEPPAASDRATEYETAPFGAVAGAPPTDTPSADDPGAASLTEAAPVLDPGPQAPPALDAAPEPPELPSPPAPPVTADQPIAEDTRTSPEPPAPGGALERTSRSPKQIALVAAAALVLLMIVRKLR
jgi:sporulation protein YlmC with PRC-barrel domain